MPNFVWPLNTIISTSFVINIMMLQRYRLPRQNFYTYWGTPAAVLFTIRNPWRDKNFWTTPLYYDTVAAGVTTGSIMVRAHSPQRSCTPRQVVRLCGAASEHR